MPRATGSARPASAAATRWRCPTATDGSSSCSPRRAAPRPEALPRLLAVGHVTWDKRPEGDVAGGSVTYATATARKLGWEAAALTTCGADFDETRALPGVPVFLERSAATTRFVNVYGPEGVRH